MQDRPTTQPSRPPWSLSSLLEHGGVYALGHILARVATVVMLPVYTRYLTPADYGVIALFELALIVAGLLMSAGIADAANRLHFEKDDEEHWRRLWWTSWSIVGALAILVMAVGVLAREPIVHITHGSEVPEAAFYLLLVLPTTACTALSGVAEQYMRVRKWSRLFVGIKLGALVFNVAANLTLLTVFEFGVFGILLGNLLANSFGLLLGSAVLFRHLGRITLEASFVPRLARFGLPLAGSLLVSTVMYRGERYFLRYFTDLEEVGLYAFGYAIASAAGMLVAVPFRSAWAPVMYEIAAQADRAQRYAAVFRDFVGGLAVYLFGVALAAETIVAVVATPAYAAAAKIIPPICLAYLFEAMHGQFTVAPMVAKKTTAVFPVVATAAMASIALDLLLIPPFGAAGAALATVSAFAVFAFVGLLRYRRIDRYPYPIGWLLVLLGGFALTVGALDWLMQDAEALTRVAGAAVAWLAWAVPIGAWRWRLVDRS